MAAFFATHKSSHLGCHLKLQSLNGFVMKIEKNTVVSLSYAVSEIGQPPFERSQEDSPLTVLIGHGNIVPGLERALIDKTQGDQVAVDVLAADAYGPYRAGLSQRIPKKHFGHSPLAVGKQVVLQTQFGPRAVTILKIGLTVVDVYLNHPFAGKDLHFDVEIRAVRSATAEEISHGHVHSAPAEPEK